LKSISKSKSIVAIAAAFAFATASAPVLHAESAAKSRAAISMAAGQSVTIDHLKKSPAPSIRVIENPHALVIHSEDSGDLVLLGADRGKWEITVTRDDGSTVAYRVNVSAVGDSARPLNPGVAPEAASDDNAMRPGPVTVDTSAVPESVSDATQWSSDPHADNAGAKRHVDFPSDLPAPSLQASAKPQFVGSGLGSGMISSQYRSDPPVAPEGSRPGSSVSVGPNYMPAEGLSLMTGTSQIIDFQRRLKRISIADSTIADIQVTTPYQLNLIGHKPGFTTLAVWDDQGHYLQRQIRIDTGGTQQVMLNVIVAELDRTKLEQQGIDLSVAIQNLGVSLASLPGSVATPYNATSALSSGTSSVAGVAPAGGQLIPLLLSGSMTYGLTAVGSGIANQTFFQFLESHNLARILAQPHLLANSGQTASFLSGGEIPIVLAQALNTSIVFKQFGTSINFLPTVVGTQDIELLVKTEVSEPDFAHGVALFGFQVPAFVTRRADTMVRLKDNQTLIMAGLILRNRNEMIHKVPYLGDVPYLGGLFRNTLWQDSETDLVMAVMPQIVRPLPAGGQVFQPSSHGPLTEDEVRTRPLVTPDVTRPRF
jgi:pilus assembly protein CpaC